VRVRAHQKVLGRHEVRVEVREELGIRGTSALLERTRFVVLAIGAAPHRAIHTGRRAEPGADVLDQCAGVGVGGIVEHLHAEPVGRPAHRARRCDDAACHGMFVEHRQLHAHRRIHPRQPARQFRVATQPQIADPIDDATEKKQCDDDVGGVPDGRHHPPSSGALAEPAATAATDRDDKDGSRRQTGDNTCQPPGPRRPATG
jgi:hypothetical protein